MHFVEVKYRREFNERIARDIKESAETLLKYWSEAWLFVATQTGFYFDSGVEIVKNNGAMKRLDKTIITPEIQDKYLEVLREFISNKKT